MRTSALLFARHLEDPSDTSILHVYGDALMEEGDARGHYVHLALLTSPTPEEVAQRSALERSLSIAAVGSARTYLREWAIGPDYLIAHARCEAVKLVDGFEAISSLNPLLALTITSLKKVSVVKALSQLDLGRIHYVDMAESQLTDGAVRHLLPALSKVKNLRLSCVGEKAFSPDALRQLGAAHVGLEFLSLRHDLTDAKLGAYAEVIASAPGFKTLRGIHLPLASKARMSQALPSLRGVEVWESDDRFPDPPRTGADVERFKRGAGQAACSCAFCTATILAGARRR